MFGDHHNLTIPRVGLAYMPPQGEQNSGKLYFWWAQHIQDFEASHGWCELNLSNPCPQPPEFPYSDRGFWAESYEAQIIFYNPDDLAAAAGGQKKLGSLSPTHPSILILTCMIPINRKRIKTIWSDTNGTTWERSVLIRPTASYM